MVSFWSLNIMGKLILWHFHPLENLYRQNDNYSIWLWNARTFQTPHTLSIREGYFYRNQSGWVHLVAFSSNSNTLANGSMYYIILCGMLALGSSYIRLDNMMIINYGASL